MNMMTEHIVILNQLNPESEPEITSAPEPTSTSNTKKLQMKSFYQKILH